MRDFVDIIGGSGSSYRFQRLRDGWPLSPMGGNFLFARFTGETFELIHAGEAQNLMTGAKERWSEAVEHFQVTELYSRLNISERVRQLELADIVARCAPPMNLGPERKAG